MGGRHVVHSKLRNACTDKVLGYFWASYELKEMAVMSNRYNICFYCPMYLHSFRLLLCRISFKMNGVTSLNLMTS